ncbi:MAG: hypothetical protein ACRC4M_04125 [Mycoplasma sp.]
MLKEERKIRPLYCKATHKNPNRNEDLENFFKLKNIDVKDFFKVIYIDDINLKISEIDGFYSSSHIEGDGFRLDDAQVNGEAIFFLPPELDNHENLSLIKSTIRETKISKLNINTKNALFNEDLIFPESFLEEIPLIEKEQNFLYHHFQKQERKKLHKQILNKINYELSPYLKEIIQQQLENELFLAESLPPNEGVFSQFEAKKWQDFFINIQNNPIPQEEIIEIIKDRNIELKEILKNSSITNSTIINNLSNIEKNINKITPPTFSNIEEIILANVADDFNNKEQLNAELFNVKGSMFLKNLPDTPKLNVTIKPVFQDRFKEELVSLNQQIVEQRRLEKNKDNPLTSSEINLKFIYEMLKDFSPSEIHYNKKIYTFNGTFKNPSIEVVELLRMDEPSEGKTIKMIKDDNPNSKRKFLTPEEIKELSFLTDKDVGKIAKLILLKKTRTENATKIAKIKTLGFGKSQIYLDQKIFNKKEDNEKAFPLNYQNFLSLLQERPVPDSLHTKFTSIPKEISNIDSNLKALYDKGLISFPFSNSIKFPPKIFDNNSIDESLIDIKEVNHFKNHLNKSKTQEDGSNPLIAKETEQTGIFVLKEYDRSKNPLNLNSKQLWYLKIINDHNSEIPEHPLYKFNIKMRGDFYPEPSPEFKIEVDDYIYTNEEEINLSSILNFEEKVETTEKFLKIGTTHDIDIRRIDNNSKERFDLHSNTKLFYKFFDFLPWIIKNGKNIDEFKNYLSALKNTSNNFRAKNSSKEIAYTPEFTEKEIKTIKQILNTMDPTNLLLSSRQIIDYSTDYDFIMSLDDKELATYIAESNWSEIEEEKEEPNLLQTKNQKIDLDSLPFELDSSKSIKNEEQEVSPKNNQNKQVKYQKMSI